MSSNRHQRKVVSRIIGGLGNQLFSYAAARRLAHANDAELVIDQKSGFNHDWQYQRKYQLDNFCIPCRFATSAERMEPFSRVRRYVKRRLSGIQDYSLRSYIQQEGVDFDERLLKRSVRGTVHIEGYWQSEKYFSDIEQLVRSDLQIRPPADERNINLAERIETAESVAVHVRFFEDPLKTEGFSALKKYYSQAIAMMELRVPSAHYYVFSDQPNAAQELLGLPASRLTLVDQNQGDDLAYADLWLMTRCQNFIIANSSFSWWGAWLSTNPNKLVIAPGFEKRTGSAWWGFDGLLPDSWTKI